MHSIPYFVFCLFLDKVESTLYRGNDDHLLWPLQVKKALNIISLFFLKKQNCTPIYSLWPWIWSSLTHYTNLCFILNFCNEIFNNIYDGILCIMQFWIILQRHDKLKNWLDMLHKLHSIVLFSCIFGRPHDILQHFIKLKIIWERMTKIIYITVLHHNVLS